MSMGCSFLHCLVVSDLYAQIISVSVGRGLAPAASRRNRIAWI